MRLVGVDSFLVTSLNEASSSFRFPSCKNFMSAHGRGQPTIATPVPMGKVVLLGTIQLVNNTSIWMIFSFLPFMVAFYYPTMPTTELGFEAGILGSAFSAGGLVGNMVSGVISDRVGRRPALLWGLMGTAISCLCFGFSPTFWFAVVSRFVWGALNGNIGVVKTYLAEISDDTNMARVMAYFGVVGSTGRIIGPVLGGMLSYPADHFSVFKHTMFATYPFALPCMVVCANCLVVFAIAYYHLPETLNMKHAGGGGSSGRTRGGVQYSPLQTSDADGGGGSAAAPTSTALEDADLDYSIELREVRSSSNHGTNSSSNGNSHSKGKDQDEQANPLLSQAALSDGRRFTPLQAGANRFSGETDEESEADRAQDDHAELSRPENANRHSKISVSPDIEMGVGPPPAHAGKQKSHRKSISFSSVVRVKVIDMPEVTVQGLKQVGPDEAPLPGPSNHSNGHSEAHNHIHPSVAPQSPVDAVDDDEASLDGGSVDRLRENLLPPLRFSNGAEFFESADTSKTSVWAHLSYLMRQRPVLITTTLYGVSSFVVIIANEVFTLWVVTSPADGGLSYTAQQIGTAIMICGMVSTLLQLTVYPAVIDTFGVLTVHRVGGLMVALSCVLTPMLGWHAAGRPASITLVLVVLVLTLQAVAANWYLVSTFVLISNSCYRHQLATVNGIGQTCASIGRLCGPYLGSVLFAWSETNGLLWPFNHYLVFYLLSILAVAIYQYSQLLPRSIQRRRREPKFRTWEEAEEHLRQAERLQPSPMVELPDGRRAVTV